MPTRWFHTRDGLEMLGPFTARKLKQLASEGRILPTDGIRREGQEKTVTARKVKGLFVPPPGPNPPSRGS